MANFQGIIRPVAGLASALFFLNLSTVAQDRSGPAIRITVSIDNRKTVVRRGDVHPLARAEYDQGPARADMRMERMVLVLQPDSAQQQALEELLAAQHDPSSQDYQ